MGDHVETKPYEDVHIEKAIAHADTDINMDEKKQAIANKAAAIEAENAEHDMGVPQAVQAYPMAALWAFTMSCTIVSCLHLLAVNISLC